MLLLNTNDVKANIDLRVFGVNLESMPHERQNVNNVVVHATNDHAISSKQGDDETRIDAAKVYVAIGTRGLQLELLLERSEPFVPNAGRLLYPLSD